MKLADVLCTQWVAILYLYTLTSRAPSSVPCALRQEAPQPDRPFC